MEAPERARSMSTPCRTCSACRATCTARRWSSAWGVVAKTLRGDGVGAFDDELWLWFFAGIRQAALGGFPDLVVGRCGRDLRRMSNAAPVPSSSRLAGSRCGAGGRIAECEYPAHSPEAGTIAEVVAKALEVDRGRALAHELEVPKIGRCPLWRQRERQHPPGEREGGLQVEGVARIFWNDGVTDHEMAAPLGAHDIGHATPSRVAGPNAPGKPALVEPLMVVPAAHGWTWAHLSKTPVGTSPAFPARKKPPSPVSEKETCRDQSRFAMYALGSVPLRPAGDGDRIPPRPMKASARPAMPSQPIRLSP